MTSTSSIFHSLNPDVIHVLLHQLQAPDKIKFRAVCKEARALVDQSAVHVLAIDRLALASTETQNASLKHLQRWPSPATLQAWGKTVHELVVYNDASLREQARLLDRPPEGFEEWNGDPLFIPAPPHRPGQQSRGEYAAWLHLKHDRLVVEEEDADIEELDNADNLEAPWLPSELPGIAELGPAAPASAAIFAAAAAATEAAAAAASSAAQAASGVGAGAGSSRAAVATAVAAAAATAWPRMLAKLPQLCSLLPHLSTLRLKDMEISASDFAAAAACCPSVSRLEYLAPPSFVVRPWHAPMTRHVKWDGLLWLPLSSFPSLTHLTLQGWAFTGNQGLDIRLLTRLHSLDITDCTNHSTDGVGLSLISQLSNLTSLSYSNVAYPNPIPSEFSGLSAITGLSALTAMDGDFFPDEVLAWAGMHLTRLSLSSSFNLTLQGIGELVPQLNRLVVLEVPDLDLDVRMARGLARMPFLRRLCVARNHSSIDGEPSCSLPQVQHLALQQAFTYELRQEGAIGAALPNIESLELGGLIHASKATAAVLFRVPLPKLTSLCTVAGALKAPEVASACPAITSLAIMSFNAVVPQIPSSWRDRVTRLALVGLFEGSYIEQCLGRGSGLKNLRELALLRYFEAPCSSLKTTDWLVSRVALECNSLRTVTLCLCPHLNVQDLYCLALQLRNVEEIQVVQCEKIGRQQCQDLVRLLSWRPDSIPWAPGTMSKRYNMQATHRHAVELAAIAGICDPKYVDEVWDFLKQLRHPQQRSVPLDIVCSAGIGDLNTYASNLQKGRVRTELQHPVASLAWEACTKYFFCRGY